MGKRKRPSVKLSAIFKLSGPVSVLPAITNSESIFLERSILPQHTVEEIDLLSNAQRETLSVHGTVPGRLQSGDTELQPWYCCETLSLDYLQTISPQLAGLHKSSHAIWLGLARRAIAERRLHTYVMYLLSAATPFPVLAVTFDFCLSNDRHFSLANLSNESLWGEHDCHPHQDILAVAMVASQHHAGFGPSHDLLFVRADGSQLILPGSVLAAVVQTTSSIV